MAARSPVRRHLSATKAAVKRHRGADDPRLAELDAELATEGLAEHIKMVVDGWPPISQATREKLALLLNPGAGYGS